MTDRRTTLGALAAAGLSTLLPRTAIGQPLDQVRIYYGFPPGSAGDAVARRIGDKMAGSGYSKSAAIVENKTGAGGRIALDTLRQAPADGATLALSPFTCTAIYPHSYARLGYDPTRDFVPVSIGAIMHHGMAVGPLVPASVTDVKSFLAWAKAHPEHASYGSPAAGSPPHFIGALLALGADAPMRHVPYRGAVPGVADLVAGQIAAMFAPSGDFLAYQKAGRLRMLATSGKERSRFSPDVPTLAEQGFPELTTEEWFGFYAPAGSPPARIEAANAAIQTAVKDPTVVDSLGVVGLIARASTPAEMAASQAAEFERWGPLVKRVGFTAES